MTDDYDNSAAVVYAQAQLREHNRQDLLRYQLETADVVYRYFLDLAGLKEDPQTGKIVEDETKRPIMNEQGANAVKKSLMPVVSRIVSLSNFDEDQVRMNTKKLAESLTEMLLRKREEYGIQYREDIKLIVVEYINLVMATQFKAYQAGEARSLRQSQIYNEQRQIIDTPKQGLFSNIFGGGGSA